MKDKIFTADQFNTWKRCPAQYYLKYIRALKYPDVLSDYEVGKSLHALLNYHLRGYDVDFFLKNASIDILSRWNLIKNHNILNNAIYKSEWPFLTRVGNSPYWVKGRIDAVFFDPENNKYIIADWKTGENIPKKPLDSFQHIIYLYSFYKLAKSLNVQITQDDVSFCYVKITDEVLLSEFKYSSADEIMFEKMLNSSIKGMISFTKDDFEEGKYNCSLRKCLYKNICASNLK